MELLQAGLYLSVAETVNAPHRLSEINTSLFQTSSLILRNKFYLSGPGCSELTTSLVNVSLNFQELISQICHYFLLKKCEKLLQCKSFSHFINKKYQCV